MEENKGKFRASYLIILLVLVVLVCFMFIDTSNPGKRIKQSDAYSLVDGTYDDPTTEEVENLEMVEYYYKNGYFYILVKDSQNAKKFPTRSDYYCEYSASDDFLVDIKNYIKTQGKQDSISYDMSNLRQSWLSQYLPMIIFVIIIGVMLFFMMRMIAGGNKGALSFGKSKARATTNSKVRFNDIAGADEEKAELQEIVEFLKNPKKFTSLGARIPKGVLLVGPPGTGKTLLAKAVAGESNVPFISISGSDFVEMFVGVGASRVRDLFDQAKKAKPCIVFIDEIDAVGRQRGAGLGGGNDEREQTLNQLLVEMDGFEANEGIIVLAATNRSDVLDPALMRPGRFDRQVYVHVPDVKGREGILRIHARNKPLDENVDFTTLARLTTGFTGADIENMLNESAILAARAGRPKITMVDITEGINKVLLGPQKKSRLVTPKDKKLTAYHESGHAILGKLLKNCEAVQEVSIIPRGNAGGYTLSRPENDDSYTTYGKLMDEIAMCMGGRIAEDLIFKEITTGASGDIQQATKLAHKMVYDFGMSKKLGFISLDGEGQIFVGRDYQTRNNYSEKLIAEADEEIRQILANNYKRAKDILTDNIKLLHEMASLLLERETIYQEEVDLLMQGKTKDQVVEIIKVKEEEQKIKEEQLLEEKKKKEMLEVYNRKLSDGAQLLKAGVITEKEYEAVVREMENYKKEIEENFRKEEVKSEIVNEKEVTEPSVEQKKQAKTTTAKTLSKAKAVTEKATTTKKATTTRTASTAKKKPVVKKEEKPQTKRVSKKKTEEENNGWTSNWKKLCWTDSR